MLGVPQRLVHIPKMFNIIINNFVLTSEKSNYYYMKTSSFSGPLQFQTGLKLNLNNSPKGPRIEQTNEMKGNVLKTNFQMFTQIQKHPRIQLFLHRLHRMSRKLVYLG